MYTIHHSGDSQRSCMYKVHTCIPQHYIDHCNSMLYYSATVFMYHTSTCSMYVRLTGKLYAQSLLHSASIPSSEVEGVMRERVEEVEKGWDSRGENWLSLR